MQNADELGAAAPAGWRVCARIHRDGSVSFFDGPRTRDVGDLQQEDAAENAFFGSAAVSFSDTTFEITEESFGSVETNSLAWATRDPNNRNLGLSAVDADALHLIEEDEVIRSGEDDAVRFEEERSNVCKKVHLQSKGSPFAGKRVGTRFDTVRARGKAVTAALADARATLAPPNQLQHKPGRDTYILSYEHLLAELEAHQLELLHALNTVEKRMLREGIELGERWVEIRRTALKHIRRHQESAGRALHEARESSFELVIVRHHPVDADQVWETLARDLDHILGLNVRDGNRTLVVVHDDVPQQHVARRSSLTVLASSDSPT
ncbi:Hypothetical Protein FCC1311_043502 [Hondaea fermentalgiana]|uniref:Uncharacterized protein n=1 Tax=Hondaea fermentalgiana TaxID=2315210 RepID=A0A2R5GAT7_9STRA|nr:Hypothetical Protein FCC1311_043502 [Hondaea fermentalgiana]|eukprot:GBG28127.1 Hypothetical Protein FCC1311_043502 [Hondaea fermentalgiana]